MNKPWTTKSGNVKSHTPWQILNMDGISSTKFCFEIAHNWAPGYFDNQLLGQSQDYIEGKLKYWQEKQCSRLMWKYLGIRDGRHTYRIYDQDHTNFCIDGDYDINGWSDMTHEVFAILRGEREPVVPWDTGQPQVTDAWST